MWIKLLSIKLSIEQFLIGGLALLVGILVFLLKLQGSRLHQAQVNLLKSHFDNEQQCLDMKLEDIDKRIADSRDKYEKALNSYNIASK